jgi:hypothetical protein
MESNAGCRKQVMYLPGFVSMISFTVKTICLHP